MNKPSKEKINKVAKRAGWLFLAILFVFTGLGVGVAAFWQATHQPKDNTSQTTPPPTSPTANACNIQEPVPNVETLSAPESYKHDGKVTKLETTDLEQGTGQESKNGDCMVMKYYGTLASNGTMFDQNYDKPTALQFTLGKGDVIKGWDQGLVGMKVGGIRRIVIPSDLGYGAQAAGSIPANSDLVFVVKLESIKQ
jgi:FKBP-type peptidyl-prolyl cis-trans isomerase